MSPRDRAIIVLALAQNADPSDAVSVLSQALEGLRAEAAALREGINETSLSESDLTYLLYSHEGRLQALVNLFDDHMTAKWRKSAANDLEATA